MLYQRVSARPARIICRTRGVRRFWGKFPMIYGAVGRNITQSVRASCLDVLTKEEVDWYDFHICLDN